ncbi:nucleotidyltransferase domain-containing protein [Aurantiacibacter sp. MUD61]|uniref:nucleotidyltransferase domain-containing protein n=1 Tax=Aurantiacibacter sp. MUD61 TaxID=3009083 RepID=UPI0022EFE506|nr:nucleotidyltransferase family protein [Aurantiacibacter sp. MUD61]
MGQDPAFALLLACTDFPSDAAAKDRIRATASVLGDDWKSFLDCVKRHRMSPLALRGLVSAGVMPPAQLKALAQSDTLETFVSIAESKRLLEVFRKATIEAIILKGPVLSQLLYDDPTLRQSKDIDLLVEWSAFEGAIVCLEADGYVLKQERPPFGSSRVNIWRRGTKDVTLSHPETGHLIELHHRLLAPEAFITGLGVADADHWVSIGGTRFRTFRQPDQFAYLAAHGANSRWHRLKWLADMRAMLAGLSSPELEKLLEHCRFHGVERCGALAMLLCHHLWGQILPDRVAELQAEDPWLRTLEHQSLQKLLASGPRLPLAGRTRELGAGFALREGFAFKRSVLALHIYHQSLVSRLPLPNALRYLYGPARMFDWILERIRAPIAHTTSGNQRRSERNNR